MVYAEGKTSMKTPGLEIQADFLRAIAERTARTGVLTADLEGRILSSDHAAEWLLGFGGSEASELRLTELLGQCPEPPSRHFLERAVTDGKWEARGALRRRDGNSFPASLTLLLRRDARGQRDALVAVVRDLSAIDRVSVDLELTRRDGLELFASRDYPLCWVDTQGHIWLGNSRFATLASALKLEAPATLSVLLGSADAGRQLLERVLTEDEILDFELKLRVGTDTSLELRCDALAVADGSAEVTGVLLAMHSFRSPTTPVEATPIGSDGPYRGLVSALGGGQRGMLYAPDEPWTAPKLAKRC